MTPLKIAAAAAVMLPADDPATPLRPLLKELLSQPPRRVSRLIELSLLGAHRCVKQLRPEPRCPLYLALTHGTVGDSVALAKAVCAQGLPTPVAFINVSSNMAGFYVASSLGMQGSNQAVSADEFPFEAALELASLGREHRTQGLIGGVEECAWPLPEHRERLGLPADAALSESSHWLYVDQNAARPLATVQWVRRYRDESVAREALLRERWPGGGLIALGANLARVSGAWQQLTGLRPAEPDGKFHSGQWAAYRICRFAETRAAPCLLHVNQGRNGCYAVYVTAH